jgi:hypothetical protein
MDLVAEFDRLHALIYACMWTSGVLVVAWIFSVIYYGRKLHKSRTFVASYPGRLRFQIVFSRMNTWTQRVDHSHLNDLLVYRRNCHRILAMFLLYLTSHTAVGVLRDHWINQIQAIGDRAQLLAPTLPLNRGDPYADARADVAIGSPYYFLFGQPLPNKAETFQSYKERYGVTLKRIHKCDPARMDYLAKYNNTVIAQLGFAPP